LVGQFVRVAAAEFSPVHADGLRSPRFIPVGQLILPDGTQVGTTPVFFEGLLKEFERRIGVVTAFLDKTTDHHQSAEGIVHFRGTTAAILRGPALVRLAAPFHVERLPANPSGYWGDLRCPFFQFKFEI